MHVLPDVQCRTHRPCIWTQTTGLTMSSLHQDIGHAGHPQQHLIPMRNRGAAVVQMVQEHLSPTLYIVHTIRL